MSQPTCRWTILAAIAASCCQADAGDLSTANRAQTVVAHKYVVASGHELATNIGLQTLRSGGNVIDAAIATSMALGVAEPYGSGLGGKLVMLYREAATGHIHSVVALCQSPAELHDLDFIQLTRNQRKYSYHAVGVPGIVAGLSAAHQRWGSLPWRTLVEPAAELADSGVVIDATMRGMFEPKVKYLRNDDEAAQLYLVNGEAPPVGARLKNADLANSLRMIATEGADAFYRGEIARRIVEAAHTAGAPLTMEDFANYRPEIGQPLVGTYGQYTLYSCPPPLTGGVTVLSALECVEQMEAVSESPPTHDAFLLFTDRVSRALQCLYPRIRDRVADVPTARDAATELLSEVTVSELARAAVALDPRDPAQDPEAMPVEETSLEPLRSASTSHITVIDAAGNMVSLTQSLSLHFGASVVAPGTGILLNDSMSNFATHNRSAVNHVDAAKRARSTIAPMLVMRGQQPHLALGIPGGQRIPTTTLQLLWRVLDQDMPLEDAFAASRFHLRRPLKSAASKNDVDYEADMPHAWVAQMPMLGWTLHERPRDGHYFGGGNAAMYLDENRMLGVADPRRTNHAAGE